MKNTHRVIRYNSFNILCLLFALRYGQVVYCENFILNVSCIKDGGKLSRYLVLYSYLWLPFFIHAMKYDLSEAPNFFPFGGWSWKRMKWGCNLGFTLWSTIKFLKAYVELPIESLKFSMLQMLYFLKWRHLESLFICSLYGL